MGLFIRSIVQLGQLKYGLVKNGFTGQVDLEQIFEPGRYWIGFWREFIEFPSYLCTIEFSDEAVEEGVQSLSKLRARDVEGKLMLIDVSLQYQLIPDELGDTYREMTTLYEDVFISELRDRLSKVGNRFKAEAIWENYTYINGMMHEECIEVLRARHADCWGVQIWGLSLIERYENSIVQTQVRKQAQRTEQARLQSAQVRARTQVELAEYRKNITIIQANGSAEKYNIERRASARAEGNLISVEARSLSLVREILRGGDGCSIYPLPCRNASSASGAAGTMNRTLNGSTSSTTSSTTTTTTTTTTMESVETDETVEMNEMNGTTNETSLYFIVPMTNGQLMRYQKYMMLQRHTEAHLVYHANTPVDMADASMEAVNVASARTIMNNQARRLAEGEPDVPELHALLPGPKTNPATLTPRQHAASRRAPTGFKRNVVGSDLGGDEESKEL